MTKPLDSYRAKRDFTKTPEPGPEQSQPSSGGNSFVVQKHAARRLHYDFRLELDGVMKSWAVTRGPSFLPGEKRLAVETEDHPIAYSGFEGVIPQGEYGGGTVMVWDRGIWEPVGDPHKGLKKGHLEFRLAGEKLKGGWHLVRMKRRAREKHDNWLMIKMEDETALPEGAPDPLETQDRSVLTGRSMDEIAEAADRVWSGSVGEISPEAAGVKPKARKPRPAPSRAAAKQAPAEAVSEKPKGRKAEKPAPAPDFVEPCLATLVESAPEGPEWISEIKFDGYRLQARLVDGEVTLFTRKGLDWTHRFPEIAKAVAALPARTALLDGEAVVLDEAGASNFALLQQDLGGRGGKKISRNSLYYAFDLLQMDGEDLRGLPLDERKARLAALTEGAGERLRFSDHIAGDAQAMIRHACRLGLEGIIVKRRDEPYHSGRGEDWLKVKCTQREEFVIAGFVPSATGKKAVGSLVMGYYESERLVHVGRVGTGYTEAVARDLYDELEALRIPASPFAEKLDAAARRGVRFVRPDLVAEVEYRGMTGEGQLRHASFKGLREDKDAREVTRADRKEPQMSDAKPKAKEKPADPDTVAGVHLTHPDRVLWPEQGLTKAGLAAYYADIAEWVLPHVVNRPLALVRCPGGHEESCFFQKHAWAGLNKAIRTVKVAGDDEPMLAIDDLAGLIGLVQAGVLEIHPWGSTLKDVEHPDRLIFDFDPGEGVAWTDVIAAAHETRERLSAEGLESFVKTTGGKGLHVVVPLTPAADWDTAKAWCRDLANAMVSDAPDRYVATITKAKRKGKILIDYLRNGRGATAVAAYSTRARAGAPVSTPLTWDELGPEIRANHFTVDNLRQRLAHIKDPWAGFFEVEQVLPGSAKRTRKKKGA